MRRRKALTSLIGIVLFAVLVLGWTFKVENSPLLGLDLRGGVSVVLEPHPTEPGGTVSDDSIETAIGIMNQRINSIGVAEPDIHRQGANIVVQIAGVKDPDAAIKIVGETAELRFRPVMSSPVPLPTDATSTTVPENQGTTPGSVPGTEPGTAPGTAPAAAGFAPPTTATAPTTAPSSTPPASGEVSRFAPEQTPSSTAPTAPTTTAAPGASTTVAATPTTDATGAATTLPTTATTLPTTATTVPAVADVSGQGGTTPRDKDDPNATVTLPGDPASDAAGLKYTLGPVMLTGKALESASSGLGQKGEWQVNPKFKGGADGIDLFNKAAGLCYSKAPQCPTGQLAMVLDHKVISAPSINAATFSADQIQITGHFTEETAHDLATKLNFGALPIELETKDTEIVSATLGADALHAGLLAGFVGLVLVAVYMIAFYRLLGLLAVLKLSVEGAMLWAFISYLGASAGLALTLAGITGIIVSIGVSLDSNVVYYEHLRDDIRHGRTVRSAVDRSFASAFSTILKADGASLLGAALLYWLAVGPVRGFAFYLGLSTILDLISSYFYMRPIVFLATSSGACRRHPGWFGLPPTAATTDAEPAVPTRPSKRPGPSSPARDKHADRDGGADAITTGAN